MNQRAVCQFRFVLTLFTADHFPIHVLDVVIDLGDGEIGGGVVCHLLDRRIVFLLVQDDRQFELADLVVGVLLIAFDEHALQFLRIHEPIRKL